MNICRYGSLILGSLALILNVFHLNSAIAASPLTVVPSDLPISFVRNVGQSHPTVQFQANSYGGTVFFTPSALVFRLPAKSTSETEESNDTLLRLHFEDSNPDANILGLGRLPGVINYFAGRDSSKWFTNVPTYESIIYENIYTGIDLQYEGLNGLLKGTYQVKQGIDPTQIRWRYSGSQSAQIDKRSGELHIALENGEVLTEAAPSAWQVIEGILNPVSTAYRIYDDQSFGFLVGSYDRSHSLIIDPVLEYSTYIGGSGSDDAWGVAADNNGNAYVTGRTESTDFPTSTGAPDQIRSGQKDIFVTKINTNATGAASLVWSTYLGGSGADEGWGIAVDESGNVYVAGTTYSQDFPVTGNALQSSLGQGTCCAGDAFLTKLNSSASSILYSTYLGGYFNEDGYDVDVDTNENAYIYGNTNSNNFPVTASGYQTSNTQGKYKTFVSRINTTASGNASLIYSTYLGGLIYSDAAYSGIAVDDSGNAFVSGRTESSDFPITANAFQSTLKGGVDAFIVRLDTTQSGFSSLVYSTYFGGSGAENFNYAVGDIATDGLGNVYITGETNSTDFPLRNAYQSTYSGGPMDVFVSKINTNASGANSLLYSTYLGGSAFDQGFGIAATRSGNIYITGQSQSINFPLLNPIHTSNSGLIGSFVTKIDTTLVGRESLIYSTFLGGGGNGFGGSAVDADGTAYVAGQVATTSFPVINGFQVSYEGNTDGYVSKLSFRSDLEITKTVNPDPAPVGENMIITLKVKNTGPETATGVIVTEVLPPTVTFFGATADVGSCSYSSNVVTCETGNILLNDEVTIIIEVVPQASALFAAPAAQLVSLMSDTTSSAFYAPYSAGGTVSVTANADAVEKDLNSPNNTITKDIQVYDFTTQTPTLQTPIDGANLAISQPTLNWNPVHAAAKYQIFFDSGNPPSSFIADVTGTSYQLPNSLVAGTYYWRIRAQTNGGIESNFSETRSLVILSQANSAPVKNSYDTATPVLSWSGISWATEYQIQINNSLSFSGTYNHTTTIPANQLSFQTPTLITGTYYWRIRAKSAAGIWASWSPAEEFTVDP